MKEFVHLHLHSEYSLLDGACRISDIPKRAASLGQKSVAITDHGVMYGVVSFYNACLSEGIKPIIGCEVYVAKKSRFDKSGSGENEPSHLVLLVKNEIGYKNLIYMVSKAFTEGFYRKPRVDIELLSEHSEGLICLSGCLAGYIQKQIMNGNLEEAERYAKELNTIFGKGNFYLELQNQGIDGQRMVNECLVGISEHTGIPVVATNDVHYLSREDASIQATMMCIQMNTQLSDGRPLGFETDEFYMKSSDEMDELFGKYENAIENTVKIADMCNFDFTFGKTFLPRFEPPNNIDPKVYLKDLVYSGLERRENNGDIVYDEKYSREDYKMRIEYEYLVVCSMGYAEYYLIVADFVCYAKSHAITTGPGRGSGAGSLLAYLIGITEIDPVKFELLFESFLNKQRVSMPDFDIDFCDRRRDEVIEYVAEKYGRDHVAQIVTFGTMAAKAALRDVGRVTGMPYSDVDEVVRALNDVKDSSTLRAALEDKHFKDLYDSDNKIRDLIDTAMALEGMPRNASTHAAGVVITDKPVSDYVPLSTNGEVIVTQFDMDTVAKLGLLKFDFLAIRYLTIISDTEREIKKNDPSFDIEKIPLDDGETYQMISQGRTAGVFQLESAGMTKLLIKIQPKSISDVMIALALYRPGPMEFIDRYLKNREDPSKIEYKIECLSGILDETCGCVMYQEQIMQIFREVAGYTYGKADIVRRAISKKKAGVIEQEREGFLSGAKANGYDVGAAEELYNELPAFANYGFKKSHAAAYSVVSYRTAYLKCHYAPMYYAALISSVFGNTAKMSEYIREAGKLGIKTLPPDINESDSDFSVSYGNIRYGLSAIKKVGVGFIERVIEERKRRKYTSFIDFISRIDTSDIGRPQIEALIKAGVFDGLGEYRSRLLAGCGDIIDSMQSKSRSAVSGQVDLFSSDTAEFNYPDISEFTKHEKLAFEKESTGMYLSGSILDEYTENIKHLKPDYVFDILSSFADGSLNTQYAEKQQVNICGMITQITPKTTKKGDAMAFATLEDSTGEIEIILFPKQYSLFGRMIGIDSVLSINAEISLSDGHPKLVVSGVENLTPNGKFVKPQTSAKTEVEGMTHNMQKLYIKVPDMECREFKRSIALFRIFNGATEAVLYDSSQKKYFSTGLSVDVTDCLLHELAEILGKDSVILKKS